MEDLSVSILFLVRVALCDHLYLCLCVRVESIFVSPDLRWRKQQQQHSPKLPPLSFFFIFSRLMWFFLFDYRLSHQYSLSTVVLNRRFWFCSSISSSRGPCFFEIARTTIKKRSETLVQHPTFTSSSRSIKELWSIQWRHRWAISTMIGKCPSIRVNSINVWNNKWRRHGPCNK